LFPSAATISEEISEMSGAGFVIDEVVSGGAYGVDSQGEYWAKDHGVAIRVFKPDWASFGKAAGPKRNRQMAEYADTLLAFWDGVSSGTANMIAWMAAFRKPFRVVLLGKT